MNDITPYILNLPKKLKYELEQEATQLGLPLAAYIRLILMNRGKNDNNK